LSPHKPSSRARRTTPLRAPEGLRTANEVEDHHNQQDDDEQPDQSISGSGDRDWHLFSSL
jgi:hypothetical protein